MKHWQPRVTPVLAFLLIVLAFTASAPGLTVMEENWDPNNAFYGYTTSLTGPGSALWITHFVDVGNNVSPPRRLHLGFGGGSGTNYGAVIWDLDLEVDFWRNGTGAVSVQASRDSGASQAWLQLYADGGGTLVAEGRHTFTDYGTYHPVTVEMDGDETAVDLVVFATFRSTPSNLSVNVDFDNFLFTADYRVCSDPTHPKMDGDVNQDCNINLQDFVPLASNWMECTHPNDESCIQ